MSVVYQAEYSRLGSIVALKVLAPELAADDVFRTRFLQESRVAAALNHPHVIPIFDAGPCGELLFISMRYVSGADLRTVLKGQGLLAPDQALLLLGQVGRGLDAAHRMGLVHRDVKPGNILIERGVDDEPDHVYLADFGITKHALSRSGLTATGQFVGTIDYIAPEQIQGKPIDGRTDIYSLGCVLYECLTGRVPFKKDLDAAVIWAHVEEMPMSPSALRRELPEAIDDVIFRALAKDPGERYTTCREFVAAARTALQRSLESPLKNASESTGGPPTVLRGQGATHPAPHVPALPALPEPTSELPAGAPTFAPGRADLAAGGGGSGAGGGVSVTRSPGGDSLPKRRGGRGAARRLVPIGVILLAIAAAVIIWRSSSGGSSRAPSHATASGPQMKNPIVQALMTTDRTTKGLVSPASCMAQSASMVTCSNPAGASGGVHAVSFRTFASRNALYDAYVAKVMALSHRRFGQNFGECSRKSTNGEVSWNHHFQHPRIYTLAQLRADRVDARSGPFDEEKQAAGRVYCILVGDVLNLVWTQNAGNMLAMLEGAPHETAWDWWHDVHHNIALSGAASMSQ